MSYIEADLTPEEVETMTRLRAMLMAAKYPKTFRVPMRDIERIESYFQKIQAKNLAEWEAAGKPDDWENPLWVMYCGPNMGPMLKGVELLPEAPV